MQKDSTLKQRQRGHRLEGWGSTMTLVLQHQLPVSLTADRPYRSGLVERESPGIACQSTLFFTQRRNDKDARIT